MNHGFERRGSGACADVHNVRCSRLVRQLRRACAFADVFGYFDVP
jgi:hypothetical protein